MKLYRAFPWIYRLYNNLKNKTSKSEPSLNPFITFFTPSTNICRIILGRSKSKAIWWWRLKTLSKDLILIYDDENNLIRCDGKVKTRASTIWYQTPYLLNSEHYLSEFIVKHLHTKLKHVSVKQILTELRRKFWLCRGRSFVCRVLKKYFFCKKYEGPPFQYPTTPPLTKVRLFDSYAFYRTELIILAHCM